MCVCVCVCVCVCTCVFAGVAIESCRRHMRHGSMWRLRRQVCPRDTRCAVFAGVHRGVLHWFRGSQWPRRWGNKLGSPPGSPCFRRREGYHGPGRGAVAFIRDDAFGAPVTAGLFRDPRSCVCVCVCVCVRVCVLVCVCACEVVRRLKHHWHASTLGCPSRLWLLRPAPAAAAWLGVWERSVCVDSVCCLFAHRSDLKYNFNC